MPILMEFPTLIGSVGGWVFILNVIRVGAWGIPIEWTQLFSPLYLIVPDSPPCESCERHFKNA